jgi:hypothetical protein
MNNTTVIIKTIGRKSLRAAIESSRREGFEPIVISDGVDISVEDLGRVEFIKLGRQWGNYGGMAANVGAAIAPTEFITFLDDDDVFVSGAGEVIRGKLKEMPKVDIWIAGVRFQKNIKLMNNGQVTYEGRELSLSSERGLSPGNVSMPTYRTSIFTKSPFIDNVDDNHLHLTDVLHVHQCSKLGFKVDWFGSALYEVRPHDGKTNGKGQ